MKPKADYNLLHERKRKGLVLVAVLWIVLILLLIGASTGRTCRLDAKVCHSEKNNVGLKWACRAGIETAMAVLKEDDLISDSYSDLWYTNDEDFNSIDLNGYYCSVEVIDEASKLNINFATKLMLMELPEMTEEIADAILDWRDKDDEPRQFGIELGYYENLPIPYSSRNALYRTLLELLKVRGLTEEVLFGTNQEPDLEGNYGWINYLTVHSAERNTDATGNYRLNINKASEFGLRKGLRITPGQAKWITQIRPQNGFTSIADLIDNKTQKEESKEDDKKSKSKTVEPEPINLETFKEIADKMTVTDLKRIRGRVNVNTASKTVLAALFRDDPENEQIAEDIIEYRAGLIFGMESIAELLNVSSITIDKFKEISSMITTRSTVYTIRSNAATGLDPFSQAKLTTEAVVDRNANPCRIIYLYQGAIN
jgi:type II secretory pathway component PulK